MAVDGYIVHLDMECVKELVRLLRSISSNVNQITRRCNETRNLYAQDVEDLRQGYDLVWQEVYPLIMKNHGAVAVCASIITVILPGLDHIFDHRQKKFSPAGTYRRLYSAEPFLKESLWRSGNPCSVHPKQRLRYPM